MSNTLVIVHGLQIQETGDTIAIKKFKESEGEALMPRL